MDCEYEYKPYVISADIEGLLKKWARSDGYQLPESPFFLGMLADLQKTLSACFGTEVEIVPERKLRAGLTNLCQSSELPIVSLDRAYLEETTPNVVGFLETNRAVDENLRDIGLVCRPNCPPVDIQIDSLTRYFLSKGIGRIALVDDVIFSGGGIIDTVRSFQEKGVVVERVITGIIVGKGLKNLRDNGVNILWLELYPEVIDEVCERDFVAGVPYSGRLMLDGDGKQYGAPYFYPLGNPVEWASIPEAKAEDFSRFCLEQSTLLWAKFEKESQATIPMKALPRKLRISGAIEEISIVKILTNLQGKLPLFQKGDICQKISC